MTERYVKLVDGTWSTWDDEIDPQMPKEIKSIICLVDDEDYMTKINAAIGDIVFSKERIEDHKLKPV